MVYNCIDDFLITDHSELFIFFVSLSLVFSRVCFCFNVTLFLGVGEGRWGWIICILFLDGSHFWRAIKCIVLLYWIHLKISFYIIKYSRMQKCQQCNFYDWITHKKKRRTPNLVTWSLTKASCIYGMLLMGWELYISIYFLRFISLSFISLYSLST